MTIELFKLICKTSFKIFLIALITLSRIIFALTYTPQRFGIDGCNLRVLDIISRLKDGESGLNAVKWQKIEPHPPIHGRHTYNWNVADLFVKNLQLSGRLLQVNILTDNYWAIENDTNIVIDPETGNRVTAKLRIKPEHISDWAKFISTLVERYDCDGLNDMPGLQYPIIRHIQISSEAANRWSNPQGYIEALRTAYEAAKKANPNIKIMAAGFNIGVYPALSQQQIDSIFSIHPSLKKIYESKIDFLEEFFSKAKSFYDILSIHIAESYKIDELIPKTIEFFKNMMLKNGYIKPIWIDDMMCGPYLSSLMSSADDSLKLILLLKGDETTKKWYWSEQSQLLVKKSILAFASGVERVFISTDVDWSSYFLPIWRVQGLIAADGMIPKPAFYTFDIMISELDNFQYVTQIIPKDNKTDVLVFKFIKPSKNIYVAWTKNDSEYIDLSSYTNSNFLKVKHIVLELDDLNCPIYTPPEMVSAKSIYLRKTPVFLEEEKKIGFPYFSIYPNPFYSETTIKYSLIKSSHVKIEIYDIAGRLVRTPVNSAKGEGIHTVIFNRDKLPIGIYFARLIVDNKILKTQKLLILN